MKLATLFFATTILAACTAGGDDGAANSAQADTSIDIDTSLVTLTGTLTVNGQPPMDSPVPGAAVRFDVSLYSTTDFNTRVRVDLAEGVATYTLKVPPGTYNPFIGFQSSHVLLAAGQHQYPARTIDKDHGTFDIDLPLTKLTSNLTLNGQPLTNVNELDFSDTTTHENFSFNDDGVKSLQPFEAYFIPGTYSVNASISQGAGGFESYTLSPSLVIR